MREAGALYENVLADKLKSTGSFTKERIEIDGAFDNIWYEAKSGNYWEHTAMRNEASIAKAKSKFGAADALAKRNGFVYHVYSENIIPQLFKDYFNKKGIIYFENFK
jgi:hypothetical protein